MQGLNAHQGPQDVGELLKLFDTDSVAHPLCYPGEILLDTATRFVVMRYIDACAEEKGSGRSDIFLEVKLDEVQKLIGECAMNKIAKIFDGPIDLIKLRRTVPCDGHFVPFHTDRAQKTMLVPLNDENEYEGGRLVFVTGQGFHIPTRPAGSATIHSSAVVHGVSVLKSGARYVLSCAKL